LEMLKKSIKLFIPVFIITIVFSTALLFSDEGCGCGAGKSFNTTIDPEDAYNMIINLKGSPSFVILDVRTQEEFNTAHIEGAINIDFYSSDFKEQLAKLNKSKTYLVYCRSGVRSSKAAKIMEKMGFTKIYNMKGGIIKWEKENLPLVK